MPHILQYGHGKYPKLNRKTPAKLLPPPCVLLRIACLITQRPRIGFRLLLTNWSATMVVVEGDSIINLATLIVLRVYLSRIRR